LQIHLKTHRYRLAPSGVRPLGRYKHCYYKLCYAEAITCKVLSRPALRSYDVRVSAHEFWVVGIKNGAHKSGIYKSNQTFINT
jgi:hypothetical protein